MNPDRFLSHGMPVYMPHAPRRGWRAAVKGWNHSNKVTEVLSDSCLEVSTNSYDLAVDGLFDALTDDFVMTKRF